MIKYVNILFKRFLPKKTQFVQGYCTRWTHLVETICTSRRKSYNRPKNTIYILKTTCNIIGTLKTSLFWWKTLRMLSRTQPLMNEVCMKSIN